MAVFFDFRNKKGQEFYNTFDMGLTVDGYWGDHSRKAEEIFSLASNCVNTGLMQYSPKFGGKCSSFGGPDDPGDRLEWQAYLPYVDRTKVTPQQYIKLYLSQIPVDSQGRCILNVQAMLAAERWPMTTGPDGKPGMAGLSYFLDPMAFYCALRVVGSKVRALPANPFVYIYFHKTRKWVRCALSDYGPHTDTGRNIDMAPGALAYIGAKTDDPVMYYIMDL